MFKEFLQVISTNHKAMPAMASGSASAFETSLGSFFSDLKGPIGISIGIHILVIIVSIISIPHIRKKPDPVSTPIPVEIIMQDSTTDKKPLKSKGKDPAQAKKPIPKMPPKVTAKQMPKSVIDPLDVPDKKEKVQKAKSNVPPPSEKVLKKPEKPKKPKEKAVKEAVVVENEEAFLSVLKNLQESKPIQSEELPVKKDAKPQASPLDRFANRMTMSESDALRHQLARCWSIQVGARYAENLVVEVKLVMNPDRTVRNATILDKHRYNRDSFFKAAADSALRAIRSPLCTPLDLPPDKYDMWKDIVVTFDPREML